MKDKLVTIGIPVYNGAKFISETLESIINQTYKEIEIIVSDNLSTDGTVEIIREFMEKDNRIKLNINPENLGFSGNLNKIIELASSEYIAIYHADDLYEPTIVKEQVKFLDENRELAGCFTFGKMIDGNGNYIKNNFPFLEKNIKENIIMDLNTFIGNIFKYGGSTLICPSSMIKKTVYKELGGYDTSLKYIEDQDMWIRVLEKYNLGVVAKELINYRVHSNQGSSYYRDLSRDELSVHLSYIKSYLDKNIKLKEFFHGDLNKAMAKDYLSLSRRGLMLNNPEKYTKNLKKSKDLFLFEKDCIKHYIFQRILSKFGFKINQYILKFIDNKKNN